MAGEGSLDATPRNVTMYLRKAYLITTEQAEALVKKHMPLVEHANRMRSHAYYPGDQIAEIEKLTPNPEYDVDEDAESDDC